MRLKVVRVFLVREALEKDTISFNSSMGAAKHHWPLAMVLLVEAQDHRKEIANELSSLEIKIQDLES